MHDPIALSPNGPTFSRLVVGVMKWGQWGHQLSEQDMLALIEQSIEFGLTTFDHADIYGDYTTEADFGKALKRRPALRQQMQLITKCSIRMRTPNRPQHKIKSYDTSIEHILASVDRSLKNLGTDYIDLLLIHRPSPLMHPDDLAQVFSSLRQKGKVRHFGVSNFTPHQFSLVHSRIKLVTNQVEASIMHLDPFLDGTFDQCLREDIRPMAWSPLGGGALFNDLEDSRVQHIRRVAAALADKRDGTAIDQILLAWLLHHPAGILPVLGTGRAERLRAAVHASSIQLTREEWFQLWEASSGQEVP